MAKRKEQDPYASREAEKYENPIPSREYILECIKKLNRLVRREELIDLLKLEDPDQIEGLRRRLRAMERDGQLIFTRRGGYGLPEKMDLVRGRVSGHKDGYGFLILDEAGDDLFLTATQMRGVFDGDIVLARISGEDRRGRREAVIVEVLERNTTTIVGRFFQENGVTYVTPSHKRMTQDILISPGGEGGATSGQMVVVEITSQPTLRMQSIGRVIEVLGEHLAPGMEIEVAIRSYNLPHMWSPEILEATSSLSPHVSEQDKKNRLDLRHLPLVTIDGEDAKDFDDAVYCEKKKSGWMKAAGWTLYVAIADVSHYVDVNTALDEEARIRGNSVYFPGYVVPMLPEILSNGLCSLKPNVDRLCLVCEMDISAAGKLTKYAFHKAVMHSQARLTYTKVAELLENKIKKINEDDKKILPHLEELLALYKVLRKGREKRGAIDFETTETKVVFGENRKIEKIVPVQRNVAHRIIEECMLMANVAAADFVAKQKIPVLYRVHEGPKPEKLADLRTFLSELGLRFPGGKKPEPKNYAEILSKIGDRPDAHLIQTVLLRSLSQAVYAPENEGHFGLAFSAYAHFTSPIRRYPDLLLHRAIEHGLSKRKGAKFIYTEANMEKLGQHCSMTERRADEATRDAMDSLKCEFIKDHLGEEFNGIITGVTGFGLFIELQEIYVEGLLHVTALNNDYYHFDPIRRRLSGERSGIVYRLGDSIRVRVVRADVEKREIDFDLVLQKKSARPKKKA